MSISYHFRDAVAIVASGDPTVRHQAKANLYRFGLNQFEDIGNLENLEAYFRLNTAQILVIDVQTPGGDVCNWIKETRHTTQPHKVFLPIIAMLRSPNQNVVRRVSECGVDDIVLVPWKDGYFEQRIDKLLTKRKPYVVTSEYIGPDRRRQDRGTKNQVELLHVPNPLMYKTSQFESSGDKELDGATILEKMNLQRILRSAELVIRLFGELDRILTKPAPNEELVANRAARSVDAIADTIRRIKGTHYAEHVNRCQAVLKIARSLKSSGTTPSAEIIASIAPTILRLANAFDINPDIMHQPPPSSAPITGDNKLSETRSWMELFSEPYVIPQKKAPKAPPKAP
jgi:DNA-binding response OmpR family regulator